MASIAATISWLRMKSNRMSVSEAEPPPTWVSAPSRLAAPMEASSERTEEGGRRMILVGGAGEEIPDARRERQQHREHEGRGEPQWRKRKRAGTALGVTLAGAGGAAGLGASAGARTGLATGARLG